MKAIQFLLLALCLCTSAHADYKFGRKHHVKNEALSLTAVELRIDGQFVGFVYENTPPVKFSRGNYVFATCPFDKATHKPNGYCMEWQIFDVKKKKSLPLALPGLTFLSVPSFSWPYIAYVRVPDNISSQDFERGTVEVSCVIVEWPTKDVVAQGIARVNVGNFETDAPGSFGPPRFNREGGSLDVTCSEYHENGEEKDISTVTIPHEGK